MPYREIFNSWLNSSLLTPEEKKELLSLTEEEKKERFNNEALKFGTSGIRALTGLGTQRLNRFTYRLISKSYAHYLKKTDERPSVLVVHDNRPQGKVWSLEVASALKSEGIIVWLISDSGALSTPILSYLIRRKTLSGGISVTASHNPKNYNGLKIFNSLGKQLNNEEEREFISNLLPLEKAIELTVPYYRKSHFRYIDKWDIQRYIDDLVESIPHKKPTSGGTPILFSGFGGTTTRLMTELAHSLHFITFHEYIPKNPNLINPENKASFKDLIQMADAQKIKYVMCADLDGDRAAIAEKQSDGSWYFFNGNEIGAILAHFKSTRVKLKNPYIVSTHVTGTLIKHLFPNIPIHLTNTGFKNISEIVDREENKGNQLLIAFEEACGILMNPMHREKDSYQQIGYLLPVIHALIQHNLSISDYLEVISHTSIGYWRGLTDYYYSEKEKVNQFKNPNLANEFLMDSPLKLVEIQDSNGIVSWQLENESWIKFRFSGTEPKLKIYYNLFWEDKEELNLWIEKMRTKFNALFEK